MKAEQGPGNEASQPVHVWRQLDHHFPSTTDMVAYVTVDFEHTTVNKESTSTNIHLYRNTVQNNTSQSQNFHVKTLQPLELMKALKFMSQGPKHHQTHKDSAVFCLWS